MLPHFSLLTYIAIALASVGSYYLILFLVYRKNFVISLYKIKPNGVLQTSAAAQKFPHQLIDTVEDNGYQGMEVLEEHDEIDTTLMELMQDEESILLVEAEQIIEKAQHIIVNIASSPANPDEVISKLSALLRDYGFLESTDYFDSINSFIAVTVTRECKLELTADQIRGLWKA